jgi:hypothetical protein
MVSRFFGILTCILLTLGLTGYSGPIPPYAPPPLGPESGLTTLGPDEYGYTLSDESLESIYAFEDISLTGNTLFFSDTEDGSAATGTVSFPYYDQVPTTLVYVNVNGFLSFDPIPTRKTEINKPFPTDSKPNGIIAAFWSNIYLGSSGSVLSRNENSPDRSIIQWNNVSVGSISDLTFEIILFSDGDIRFVYQPVSGSFTDITAGIEDADGVSGLNYGIPDLSSGESVLISRPGIGAHLKARPQVSSSFFTSGEAWFNISVTNTTTDPSQDSDSYDLTPEILLSDPGIYPWGVTFYDPSCSSVITAINSLARGATTQLCIHVTAGGDQVPGYYIRIKVTLTSYENSNRSSVIYLQASVGSPFVQLYQDSASGLKLDFTNDEGMTTLEIANPYGGSHMAMNKLKPGHYMITWLEGSYIKYRMYDQYPGSLGSVQQILASPDDSRNLIDLTPAVAGSRDGYAGILYIVNKYQTNGLGHTELNANVWYALINPDGTIVDGYPHNMTNKSGWLDLVTGYPADPEIPQYQDPRIVPVGQDKMGLVWRTNLFPTSGGSMDKIEYAIAKTDGSDFAYWEIEGASPSNRHVYPATTSLSDGRFVISYTDYTSFSNPWAINYTVIDTDGLVSIPSTPIPGTNGWQVDITQLGGGEVFFGWQDINTSEITYAILGNDLVSLVALPSLLSYEDYPGHSNYRAGGYPSVTRSMNGNAIITWQDQDWQEQLYYALIGPDGDEVTPPILYRRVGSTLPESQISTNAYGNAPLADEQVFLSFICNNLTTSYTYYYSVVFR